MVVIALAGVAIAILFGVFTFGAPGDSLGLHEYAPSIAAFVAAALFVASAWCALAAERRLPSAIVVACAFVVILLALVFVAVAPLWLFIGPFGVVLGAAGLWLRGGRRSVRRGLR